MQEIIKGAKASISVRIMTAQDGVLGDPYDLTGVTAISTCFKKDDNTDLTLGLGTGITIVGNPILGKLTVALTTAQTDTLADENSGLSDGILELTITKVGDPDIVRIQQAYKVVASIC